MPNSRLNALKKSLQLEHDGMVFYAVSMEKSTSEFGRKMFEYLHDAEKDHIKRINEIYHQLEQSADWPELTVQPAMTEPQRQSIFTDAIEQIRQHQQLNTDDLGALKQAAEFERNGGQFYSERANATEDPFEQAFFQQLADEEGHHLRAIEDSIQMLEDPQGFFAQFEKGTLSG